MKSLEVLNKILEDKEQRRQVLDDPARALRQLSVSKVRRPRLLPANAADLNVYRP